MVVDSIHNPATGRNLMLAQIVDLCTFVFVIVDDLWQEIGKQFPRPGFESEFSDSEVIALALIAEMLGFDRESQFLSFMRHNYLPLFPKLPERSRFNRRRRNLALAINEVRRLVLQRLPERRDNWRVVDSLPIPVLAFCRANQARPRWSPYQARFGKAASKKLTFYGYKLHFLVTLEGIITDFVLAPANEGDITLIWDVTKGYTRLNVLGDKGYVSEPERLALQRERGITLVTPRRSNQQLQLSAEFERLLKDVRRIIETVGSQLSEQFNIERNRARSFWGLCARLYTKLTAHTLGVYLNRIFGLEPLHLAQLITVK
jgi:hypothetical protein